MRLRFGVVVLLSLCACVTPGRAGTLDLGIGNGSGLTFSADGSYLVFASDRNQPGYWDLYSVRADGAGAVTQISVPRGDNSYWGLDQWQILPDSSRVIYLFDAADYWVADMGIYSVPIAGGASMRLNAADSDAKKFVLSPSGNQAIYTARPGGGAGDELYARATNGTGASVMLSGGTGQVKHRSFLYTPDGSWVVYRWLDVATQRYELWSRPSNGTGVPARIATPGTNDREVWDYFDVTDTHAVYLTETTDENVYKLYAVPVGGGPPVQLNGSGNLDTVMVGSGYGRSPSCFTISPDGNTVVYMVDDEVPGRFEVFARPVDGSAAAVKISGSMASGGGVEPYSGLRFTASGNRVIFRADKDVSGRQELYTAAVAGGDVVKLSHALPPSTAVSAFTLSHDRETVVYQTAFHDGTEYVRELYAVTADGSTSPVKMSHDGITVVGFAVSPADTLVTYFAKQRYPGTIYGNYFAPLDGRPVFQVFDPDGNPVGGTLSSDDSRLAYFGKLGGQTHLLVTDMPVAPPLEITAAVDGEWLYQNTPATDNVIACTVTLESEADSAEGYEVAIADSGPGGANLGIDPASVVDHGATLTFDIVGGNAATTSAGVGGAAYTVTVTMTGLTTGEQDSAEIPLVQRLLGDANGDGQVTGADFSVWKSQNGQTGPGWTGDFNGDGQVTGADFSIWKLNNGQVAP